MSIEFHTVKNMLVKVTFYTHFVTNSFRQLLAKNWLTRPQLD